MNWTPVRAAPRPSGSADGEDAPGRRRRRGRRSKGLLAALGVAVGVVVALPEEVGLSGLPEATPSQTRDRDGDGLPDSVELAGWMTPAGDLQKSDPDEADMDGDGLSDGDEAGELAERSVFWLPLRHAVADPAEADTDRDGLDDASELDLSLDPFVADSDGDGLEDGREVLELGTIADVADTDGDGFDDAYEVAHWEDQGLDPLWPDVKVDKWTYAADYAKGLLAGDLWREDSTAWLAGNLTSGATSSVPVIGSALGGLTDIRDAIGSAVKADWVGTGFSLVGAVPGGDLVAIPRKSSEFVARNPHLAAASAATIAALPKVPEEMKFKGVSAATPGAKQVFRAGAGKKSVLRLAGGRTNLDTLAETLARSGHVAGTSSPFLAKDLRKMKPGPAGERALEAELRRRGRTTSTQVVLSTRQCVDVCNARFRRFDVLADGVAHEAKVGHVPWSASVRRQILSDAHFVAKGGVEGAHWHFYPSAVSNTVGASPKVFDLLDELRIPYTVHVPK